MQISICVQARPQPVTKSLLLKAACHLLHVLSEVDLCVSFCATDSLSPLLLERFDERPPAAHGTGKSTSLPSLPHFLRKIKAELKDAGKALPGQSLTCSLR